MEANMIVELIDGTVHSPMVPSVGDSICISDMGEAIVRAVRHLDDGSYITLEIAEGMTGMVFTSLLEVE
jgi:hypothetical protein